MPHVPLKELLLGPANETDDPLTPLADLLRRRIDEGNGETLFELGVEDNGESMGLSRDEWDVVLDRLRRAAASLSADCRSLLTRNVGGDVEVETKNDKGKGAIGKIMIRQKPDTVEDVIETRIAVVGNGREPLTDRLQSQS